MTNEVTAVPIMATNPLKRISDAVSNTLEALHLTHPHHPPAAPKCELAKAVLQRVRDELGADGFGAQEAAFCDEACLQRYLRARSMDVG